MTDDHPMLTEQRRARLTRAERILDRWLDLFEAQLENARPDPSKTTELSNVFTICRRILEIEQLMQKLADKEEPTDGAPRFQVRSDVFGDGIPELDSED